MGFKVSDSVNLPSAQISQKKVGFLFLGWYGNLEMEKSFFKILKYFICFIFIIVSIELFDYWGLLLSVIIIKELVPLIDNYMKNRKRRKRLYE